MFLNKIRKMAKELGKDVAELTGVARECLLYGMNITRTPGALKREIKKLGTGKCSADLQEYSKSVTKEWSGNAYLRMVLPRLLTNRKEKIPDLEDFLFVRQFLTQKHYDELMKQVQNLPELSVDQIIHNILPDVKKVAWKGRFLPQCDQKHGSLKDVEQDLVSRAMIIVNKEFMNFNTTNPDDIYKYVSYCMTRKAKTHFKSEAPRMSLLKVETPQELEQIQSQSVLPLSETNPEDALTSIEFRQDIEKLLPKKQRDAVFLLLDMAEPPLSKKFESFLSRKGKDKSTLTPVQLKKYIASFLDVDVFETLQNSEQFRQYLYSYR